MNFGVQNNSIKTVRTASKLQAGHTFTGEKRNLSISLSLGFTQITCNSEHQCCQVITEWEKPFVVGHMCGVPIVSGPVLTRIQGCLGSDFVFQYFLGSRQRDTGFSLCSEVMTDTGGMSIQASLKRFRITENLPIHLTVSMFPLLLG